MRIVELDVFSFPVPFKVVFRHASASRDRAENLIVAVRSQCGHVGYGEGCPRSYVTGESVTSGMAFIRSIADAIKDEVHDEGQLRNWILSHRSLIDGHPAAFCAVEIAILDLLGKIDQQPIEDLIGVPRLAGAFHYSAVLGDAPYLAYRWQFQRYWNRGFRDFKVKVSGDPRRDGRKIGVFKRRSDPALRVRLDANNLWTSADACIRHVNGLSCDLFAIEEPLQQGDLAGFKQVAEQCGTKIILDESLLRREQLDMLDGVGWIVNLRVSKMGGIIRSLEVAQKAAEMGIAIIVGAQVGETSLLTRAALTVMAAHRANLAACEGAFGTHLLQRDLTSPSLTFGNAGALAADNDEPGLGLHVHDEHLVAAQQTGA